MYQILNTSIFFFFAFILFLISENLYDSKKIS